MITFRIILAVFGAIFCLTAAILHFKNEELFAGFGLLILGLFNIFFLTKAINDMNDMHNNETTVNYVKEYKVDSTTVINNSDTTKIYKITYWKYE